MQYRKFGNTDLKVSEIGFGAWAIGGNAKVGETAIGWGKVDDEVSKKAIKAALDKGINFFDTADFYGLGHSEKTLGEVLPPGGEVIVATKVGHRNIDDKIVLDYSKEYIVKACEQSLKRLRRERIDYYQLHSARMNHLKEGDCIGAMELLKQQGKIRYWGLSLNTFYPDAEADYLMDRKLGQGFQLVFNLINQKAISVMKRARQNGFGVIARMPLQFGLLTGKFSGDTQFAKDDHRSFRLTPGIIEDTLRILHEKVWPVADEEGVTKTQLALSYILSFPEISTIIPGIRTPEHVIQNTTGLKQLTQQHVALLHSLSEKDWKPVIDMMEKQG